MITVLNEQVKTLQGQAEGHFGRHPDAEIYLSQPGTGKILGARVLGKFGDDPRRYRDGKARRKYAAISPLTRASGKKVGAARFIHNDRLVDGLNAQAFAALGASPGARAYYDELRARKIERNDALRRLANRLVGILHGCLKAGTFYDEATAWATGKTSPIFGCGLTFKLLRCLSVLKSASASQAGQFARHMENRGRPCARS